MSFFDTDRVHGVWVLYVETTCLIVNLHLLHLMLSGFDRDLSYPVCLSLIRTGSMVYGCFMLRLPAGLCFELVYCWLFKGWGYQPVMGKGGGDSSKP